MLSIVCPIYNEEKSLSVNSGTFRGLSRKAEMIFIDGGSTDRSIELASRYGNILRCRKGRACQMNYGARYARHNLLFFLHADNIILPETLFSIERELKENGFIGGCLTQRIDKEGLRYRIIEAMGNIRARLSGVFYGDQGIFVKTKVFFQLGGFPEVPIMEDVLFTRKLRKSGKTVVLADKIFVSPRRWENKGVVRTTLCYNLINLAFKLGISLEKIRLLYKDIR